jgi:predicted DNA-binding transcriptional regulator YafY
VYKEAGSMKKFLLKCQMELKPVEIMYITDSGLISQRTITIKDMQGSIIRAYCHLRKRQRVFKIENILSINYRKAVGSYEHKFITEKELTYT